MKNKPVVIHHNATNGRGKGRWASLLLRLRTLWEMGICTILYCGDTEKRK